ncbi:MULTISPECIES: copper resistance system multicopper oxidase [Sphingobium]|jgi:CopA family copper-resistance protein|uniref:copper resistance system multicopper oxidase n=1 Tax=Sphingobium TaxID=165695 RepID=UPI000C3B6BE1|nr:MULTISPECIES: copper resistance system multicopper oxidase [Sphingobium]MBA37876.1 copper-binding protein [Sphingobium sp.]MEC9018397.1 copper resistance system multicopper oxidase [Pseudomonadota bacterium]MBS46176.1 copper-binding protein [Sphingobium sp.]MCC4255118.1 copper resistance system multicopper oxidase [Sphingobium lactosutens]MEE2741717.1 copper resistance system multicopper oxidase [Pseudomonadota bacterium]|tara:strand:+ start:1440 stop:3179 length:1740 start_codon:yes stop_codon:yes gene_type:complete
MTSLALDRRTLIRSAAALPLARAFPAWAQSGTAGLRPTPGVLSGDRIELAVSESHFTTGGRSAHAVTINGTLPAPLIRLKEGQNVQLVVHNLLKEDTSIHWHGLIVPFHMDGVPGISFPGIRPGETFTYEFPIRQSGTYWYHSHSGMQEAMGHYGPIVIDPAGADPVRADREHVIVLSDWSPVHPHKLMQRLKQMGGYYNMQKQTLAGLLKGRDRSVKDRMDWGRMRMDPTDISDVTGSTYSYLVNGHGTAENWTGLFAPGERVRLRIVNASAMTNFNLRLPGLAMTVVQCDGQHVQPVETDEFQIAIAETYDVIVEPAEAKPYGLIAEAIDRSGLVRATLAPQVGMIAPVPPLRQRPLLTMKDMGMDMSGMDMGHNGVIDLSQPANDGMAGHSMKMLDPSVAPQVPMGPGVATLSPMPADRTADRPTGLEDVDHRVLTYADLKALKPNGDTRAPTRSLDIHLTANMERYMWSFDGVKLSDGAEPIAFRHMERVRVTLINDTMMPHPIHIHGHFFQLVTGEDAAANPRKHTVNVLPGGKVSFDLTADAIGDWAFHCHMLMHMHAGMMRVVTVRHDGGAA